MRAFSPYSFRSSSKAMVLARNMPMTNFAPCAISLRRSAMKVAPVVSTSSTALFLPLVLESDGLGKEYADDELCPMRYQLAPQRYESSSGSKHVVHEQDALSPEPFGMELQIGGAVSVSVRALVLRPVISDGYRPNFAPCAISLRRSAMKVAPVVSTSSTSKTHFPLNRSGWNSRLAVRSPFPCVPLYCARS